MGHREPGHRAAEDPAVHGAPALGGRDILQVRNSVQEADAAVDQHALEAEAKSVQHGHFARIFHTKDEGVTGDAGTPAWRHIFPTGLEGFRFFFSGLPKRDRGGLA